MQSYMAEPVPLTPRLRIHIINDIVKTNSTAQIDYAMLHSLTIKCRRRRDMYRKTDPDQSAPTTSYPSLPR